MRDIDYWERANVLRGEAEYQDFKYGSGTYEWEMGSDAIACFDGSLEFHADEVCVFMDIPVRVNRYDRECLKLWREVEI